MDTWGQPALSLCKYSKQSPTMYLNVDPSRCFCRPRPCTTRAVLNPACLKITSFKSQFCTFRTFRLHGSGHGRRCRRISLSPQRSSAPTYLLPHQALHHTPMVVLLSSFVQGRTCRRRCCRGRIQACGVAWSTNEPSALLKCGSPSVRAYVFCFHFVVVLCWAFQGIPTVTASSKLWKPRSPSKAKTRAFQFFENQRQHNPNHRNTSGYVKKAAIPFSN